MPEQSEGLVADEAFVIHDDHVEVKSELHECSFVHFLDEDHPDHHRSPDWCQRSRVRALLLTRL